MALGQAEETAGQTLNAVTTFWRPPTEEVVLNMETMDARTQHPKHPIAAACLPQGCQMLAENPEHLPA